MIELIEVAKKRGERMVLRNFNLRVGQAERVILSGPSGSGKTTILRLIAGLDPPDQGTILIDGIPASSVGRILLPPERRCIGFVFQDLALWPHMNVRENVEFPLKAQGIPKSQRLQRVAEMLATVDLGGLEDRHPSTLSGGEQQRVAIARALITNPKAMLMDEPLANLDETLRAALCERIIALQSQVGFALVYVAHGSDEIRRLNGRVIKTDAATSNT